MTKACKCDRCGELFPIRENDTPYRIEKYEGDHEWQELDLCNICMYNLEQFMKKPILNDDIPENLSKPLLKEKPLELRFAGYSPHDCESRWACPCPSCDHMYGSWWFYNKKLKAHDTFVCDGCHNLLEVPEEEI